MDPEARHRLQQIQQRAALGDPNAYAFVESIRQRANLGDPQAHAAMGAIAETDRSIRTQKAAETAEIFYAALRARDPRATAKFQSLMQRAQGGDPRAARAFEVLKQIHYRRKATSFAGAGAPQRGMYGMPSHHRVGIDTSSQVGPYGFPLSPILQAQGRSPAVTPMTPMPRPIASPPAGPFPVPSPIMPGEYPYPDAPAPGGFLPVTPEVFAHLISMAQAILVNAQPRFAGTGMFINQPNVLNRPNSAGMFINLPHRFPTPRSF